MKKIIMILLFFCCHNLLNAQETPLISNVKWLLSSDNTITISYDFKAEENEECKLGLRVEDESGNEINIFSIKGDYPKVKNAGSKKIIWDVLKDWDTPDIGKITISIDSVTYHPFSVSIESVPNGCGFVIDGRIKGITPQTVSIMPGEHKIDFIESADYHALIEAFYASFKQKKYTFALSEKWKNFQVTSNVYKPSLFVDGELIGTAPGKFMVERGEHNIILTREGYIKRSQKIYFDDDIVQKKIKLKQSLVVGLGLYLFDNMGGELIVNSKRVGIIIGVLGNPFSEYYDGNIGISGQLSYRFPYPIDFYLNCGIGLESSYSESFINEFTSYYPIIGMTLPFNLTSSWGIYIKGEYWFPVMDSEKILLSAGILF